MNARGMEAPAAKDAAPKRAGRLGAFLILALLLALVHVVGLAHDDWSILDGELMGPDSYMRLVRVERLYETGDWYDSTIPRSNTPYGETLHWSRPFDVLLLAGALLSAPALGFDGGLFLAGVLIGPILHFLTLLALLWGARTLLSRPALGAMAVMFLFQASISSQFQAGQPDHHGLQALLFAALIACTLRLLALPRVGMAVVTGGLAAAAIWVSVEGLLAVALAMAALAAAWLVRGATYVRAGTAFALAAAGGLALALALERPPAEWLTAEYDRLSVAHLAALLAHAGVWGTLWLWHRIGSAPTSPRWRGVVVVVGVLLAATATWLLYPKLFAGPMVDVSPRVREIWLPQISEMMSIVGQADRRQSWYLLLLYLGAALPGAAYMVWLVRRSTGVARSLWLFLLLATLLYLGLALLQLRWGIYAQIASLPAYGRLLHEVLLRLGLDMTSGRRRRFREVLLATAGRLAVLLIFALGFPAAALLARPAGEAQASPAGTGLLRACDIAAVARTLDRPPQRILTYIFDGPELLYWTPHAVVGTPYHRNGVGILDTYDFFAAIETETAREIVRRRGIDWLLFCPRGSESLLYRREGETTLLDRLSRGEAPAWLKPIPLPSPVSDEYLLFEVRP